MAKKPREGPAGDAKAGGGMLKPPAELVYEAELKALGEADRDPRPPGWKLSPRAVRAFLCGSETLSIRRKFFGDDTMIERAIVSLSSNRGLMLVGEPGTAKSMISELLAAAISGSSINAIQGTAGTTEDHIKYSWNYALLLAEGPSPRALVPSPLYVAMKEGTLVRFEEITRCPPEIQDTLVSILSEKVMIVPELDGPDRVLHARPGFNVIGTANTRDRGVNEMSSALKRRFNFETVHPIRDLKQEIELVGRECDRLLKEVSAPVTITPQVVELLVSVFQELREGVSREGIQLERPSTVMSTAEAVSVAMAAGLDAFYFDGGALSPRHVVRHLAGAVLKDNPDDLKKLKHYFDVVVKPRSQKEGGPWTEMLEARKSLP
ncbi:ATP-binding protein [Aquisphaera insulae]|uniref:ATP-binding protein n=1 Tax=Aquisphaera insulae TaxID=2712864 RepID=UPI0013EB9A75|nr:AAA family ATPase [Aquisphaera insulae]